MKIFLPFTLACIILLATGCPIGLDFPLGKPGTENIDKKLIGTWYCEGNDDVVKVKISKSTDTEYSISVLEKGEMYSLEETEMKGYVTKVKGESFFFAKPEAEDKYYHYHYEFNGKDLEFFDISLLVGGIDSVTSTEALIEEVKASMENEGWGKEKKIFVKN